MLIPHRDLATSGAANLVITQLVKVLGGTTPPKKTIIQAVIPIFGIRWNATVLRRVGKEKLRKVSWPLRNSKLDLGTYLKVRSLWLTANTDEANFPQLWEPWRSVVGRFNLDDGQKLASWAPAIDTFIKKGWDTPHKLALVKNPMLQTALVGFPQKEAALQLWTATVLLFTDLSSASYLLLKGASSDAEKLISQLRTAPLRLKAVLSDTYRGVNKLRLSKKFGLLGPAAKLAQLRKAHVPQYKLDRFFRTVSQNRALTGVLKCFRSFASGIRCYYSFCELRGTPPFPVRERIIAEWGSISALAKPTPTM